MKHDHILKISAKNGRIVLHLFPTILSSVHYTKMKCVSYHIYIWHTVNLWHSATFVSAHGRSKRNSQLCPLSIYHHHWYTATFNRPSLIVLNKHWCYIWDWLYKDLIVKLLVKCYYIFPIYLWHMFLWDLALVFSKPRVSSLIGLCINSNTCTLAFI